MTAQIINARSLRALVVELEAQRPALGFLERVKLATLRMNLSAVERALASSLGANYRVEIGIAVSQGWVIVREADGDLDGELLLSFDTKEEAEAALAKVYARRERCKQ